VRPRLRVVGDPCLGIGPGDEEHPKSMVTRRTAGKRAVRSFHQALIKNRLTDLGKSDGTAINSQDRPGLHYLLAI
jgi:hypothetical protein